jgi:hypothetical protein
MAYSQDRISNLGMVIGPSNETSVLSFSLDTAAFVYQSAGTAVAFRFVSPVTANLSKVLFYLTAAPASAHNLQVLACAFSATATPGTQLTNGLVNVSGGTTANSWVTASFASAVSLTFGVPYFIVIGDPNWTNPNTYSIQRRLAYIGHNSTLLVGYSSTNGFSTAGTGLGNPVGPIVLVFSDGTQYGCSINGGSATIGATTLERGVKITPTEDITICGLFSSSAFPSTTAPTLKIYEGESILPGGAIYSGFNGGAAYAYNINASANGTIRFPDCNLRAGTTYRIVIKPSSASGTPWAFPIGNYDNESAATKTLLLNSAAPWLTYTLENASPGWTDSLSSMINIGIIVKDQVFISRSQETMGGGGSMGGPIEFG